ncbi:MAG: hypothetical protein HY049_15140 [Acidobacteria bacterium]|nr:hypothetical protein [Acidobacteriota bacterium]
MIRTRRTVVLVATAIAVVACSTHEASKSAYESPSASPPLQAQTAHRAAPPLVDSNAPLPPGHPAVGQAGSSSAPGLPPIPAGAGEGERALAWTAPADWIAEPPASSMRRAQYKVPGKGGDGECAVFYFGPGQGGDPMANAQRWASQFTMPDGSPAEKNMKTSEIEVAGFKVTLVEVAGTYNGGMTMGAAPSQPKPGYHLLGAIAPGPDANWYFKFTGPEATVQAQRAAFESMVKSLKHGA